MLHSQAMIKIFFFVVLISYTHGLKNPCRRNSPIEYFLHPESIHGYIQCSKNGEMFIRECMDEKIWNDSEKKCVTETKGSSQIKKLAAKYKINQLLAKRPNKQADIKSDVESNTQHLKINKSDREIIDIKNDIAQKQNLLETMDIETRNIAAEKMNMKIIEQTQKDLIKRENEQFKNQILQQQDLIRKGMLWALFKSQTKENPVEEMNLPDTTETTTMTTTTTISPRDQLLLDQQVRKLNEMNSIHKIMEEFQLKQQRRMNEYMSSQSKIQAELQRKEQNEILQQQRDNQSIQLEFQIEQQKIMMQKIFERKLKEKMVCQDVKCKDDFRCAMDENQEAICYHQTRFL